MECVDGNGNALCHCGRIGPNNVQVARAVGWHYSKGTTIGGTSYEEILCPACAKDEHRRKIVKPAIAQDDLPINWDDYRAAPQSRGGHTQ